ncbi:MAG: type IX secretion system membrane protein PorP/SprF [Chitinophagales bacterium]|nr:type IX secretion system membrane protein PorP/SprF [Bacteroidota bacterium]MCB9043835.1 type IX secretion system membrane protein PorP/SprF [Chitinophagales bacterium]
MKKILLSLFICLFFLPEVKAQQDAQYTQYMFNSLLYNPAYAGSRDALSATAFYRKQWLDIEGAPRTISLAVHSPVFNDKVGLGFSLENDQIGVINQNRIFTDYSYTIAMSNGGKLAMGLKAGITLYDARWSTVITSTEGDPVYGNDVNLVLPNFGAGLYYYSDRFYAGFSVPHLLKNKLESEESNDVEKISREELHVFTTAGFMIPLSENLKLKPSFLVKYVPNAPVATDVNVNFLLKDMLWLGTAVRSNMSNSFEVSSINFNVMVQATPMFRLGYAYDYATSALSSYTRGTHEVMIGYDLIREKGKVITPRYF